MFFILSKTIPYLLMPLTLIIGAMVISLFLRNQVWKKRLQISSISLLILCSNPIIINQVFKLWEIPPTSFKQITASRTVGIVLTGVVKKEKLPHDRVYFAEGADRVTHAIQLYKAGKIQKIIITGGTGSFSQSQISEAPQLREVFLMCNVPEKDIVIEGKSRNTRENALAVAEILKGQFQGYDHLLITSAFHMRRSVACFENVGVTVTGFSTDFKTGDYPPKLTSYFIPQAGAIFKWHLLVRELLGMAAYKMAGYI